jgi:WD40 repeat protein
MISEKNEFDPYVGPRPFGRAKEDRARFFGRDREADEIVSLIFSHSVLVVHAQSGAGKTSLFEAQVAHALETKGFQVLPLARVRAAIPEGVDPTTIGNLYVFAALLSLQPAEEERMRVTKSLATNSLAAYLKARAESPSAPRCIVFDQFEEIFTDESVFALRPTRWQEEQEAFFREVAEAVGRDPLLRAVFVIRKEHLAELDRFATLLPESLRTRFHLEPLGRQAALSAVTLPLRNTGRSFEDGVPEELVEKLLVMRVDVGGREIIEVPGRLVEPLHLQLVCQSLWEDLSPHVTVITKEHLRELGDVDHVLGELYDAAVRAASSSGHMPEKRLRRQIESDLITPAGTRGIVFVSDTADGTHFRRAVGELERHHLIRADRRAGANWYELTHDRLIEPIRASNERYRAEAAGRLRWWLAAGLAVAAIAGGIAAVVSLAWTSDEADFFRLTQNVSLPGSARSAPTSLSSAAFSPDARFIVTAGADGRARVWLLGDKKKPLAVLPPSEEPARLSTAAFSPTGEFVVTAGADGKARVWNWRAKKVVRELAAGKAAPLSSAAFDPEGKLVLTAGADGAVRVWDWKTKAIANVLVQPATAHSAAFCPEIAPFCKGSLVVTAGADGVARVWDWSLPTSTKPVLLNGGKGALTSAAFSPNGKFVVTAGVDGETHVWNWRAKKVVAELTQPGRVTSAVFFSGEFVLTAGSDGTARVWGWESRDDPAELIGPSALSSAAAGQGALVVTAGTDGFARIYRPEQVSS